MCMSWDLLWIMPCEGDHMLFGDPGGLVCRASAGLHVPVFFISSPLTFWKQLSYLWFFFWHLLLSQVVKSRFLLSFLFALDLLKRETSCQNACSRTWILKLEKVLLLFPGRFVTASVRFPSSSGRSKVNKKLELWPSTLVCNSASPLAKSLSTFVWTVHMFILFTGVSRRQKEYCSW